MAALRHNQQPPPLLRGSGQRQPITHRYRSCSWDVFAYDLLPNQLRSTNLLLGQVSRWTAKRWKGRFERAGIRFDRDGIQQDLEEKLCV